MHHRVIEMQHQPQLPAKQRQKIVAAGVCDFMRQDGPALFGRPLRPIGRQKQHRPTPADRGRRDQFVRLADFDRIAGNLSSAQSTSTNSNKRAVMNRPAAKPLPANGQNAQNEPQNPRGHGGQKQDRDHFGPAPTACRLRPTGGCDKPFNDRSARRGWSSGEIVGFVVSPKNSARNLPARVSIGLPQGRNYSLPPNRRSMPPRRSTIYRPIETVSRNSIAATD